MALLLIEGFDAYDQAHMQLVWSDAYFGGAVDISSSVYRTTGRSLYVWGQDGLRGRLVPASSRLFAGFAIYSNRFQAGGVHTYARFSKASSGVQLSLGSDTAGRLILRRADSSTVLLTGTTALNDNTWYFIELMVTFSSSTASGDCVIRINGVVEATLGSGADTNPTGTGDADRFEVGCRAPSGEGGGMFGSNTYIDDVYVLDPTGPAPNNTFLGDCSVETIKPTGAGTTTQWTPSTGSNYQNVDDIPVNDDTDYNSTANAGDLDLFAMQDLASTPVAIYGVAVQMWTKKDASGSRLVAPVVRMGGANYVQSSVSVGNSYASAIVTMTARPSDGAPFTGPDVNGMEVGIKLVS